MARPPTPPGTWGRVNTKQYGQKWKAWTRFRDYDGRTRLVSAWGRSGAAAKRSLSVVLRDRADRGGDDIDGETRLERLASLWLDEVKLSGRISPQTVEDYERLVEKRIVECLGGLRLRECSVSRVDRFLKEIHETHPSTSHQTRTVLKQMLDLAVRPDALQINPVLGVARLPQSAREVRSLTLDDLVDVRQAVRQWQEAPAKNGAVRPGPKRTGDLADIVDIMLATGSRIGEVLAIRWSDVDLSSVPATVAITGTLVELKGNGLFRQPKPKTAAGFRGLGLPPFAVEVLLRRQIEAEPNKHDAVLPSRSGTWPYPANIRRQWREARADTKLDWVTPHVFRKTVATIIDREVDSRTAAAQLGHAHEQTTRQHYIERARPSPGLDGHP